MGKLIGGTLLGAAALFLWGTISWMVLPLHDKTIKTLPEERLITDTLKVVVPERGFYFFPSDKTNGTLTREDWAAKYKQGPIGVLIFSPTGREPMGPSTFVIAIVGDILAAALIMFVLVVAKGSISATVPRMLLAVGLGVLTWLTAYLPSWNWFSFPTDYTLVMLVDAVCGFALSGLAMARFVPKE